MFNSRQEKADIYIFSWMYKNSYDMYRFIIV